MIKRLVLSSCAAVFALASQSLANETGAYNPKAGNWVTIYLNDFAGRHFVGVTKHQACVSAAKKKALEFMEAGMAVSERLAMEEMVAYQVSGLDDFLVFCNANGVLVVEMLVKGEAADAMAKRETAGTAARSGDVPPTVTNTEIDLKSGTARSTTVSPSN